MNNKKGEILIENVIFIVLNLVFLTILVLFLLRQGTGAAFIEEAYSKQIALLVDSAIPGMIIKINMDKGLDIANEKGIDFKNIIFFEGNYVTVKLADNGGHEYHFFNDVRVNAYPDINSKGEYSGIYVLTISKK